ncbi:MAG TPA: DsbA family protein [Alphaproteobacteria bacterium]|nr:DsbA family protein [Alphaproteobacteria bacterium]
MRFLPYFVAGLAGAAVAAALLLWVPGLTKPAAPDFASNPAFERAVAQYIAHHPEAIQTAIQALQDKAQADSAAETKAALVAHARALDHDPNDLVLGNPKGDVTLVEFFDYRCPYCKRDLETVTQAVKADGNVRLVLKEFPILGPDSVLASRAAIASQRQGKYAAFHTALLASPVSLDADSVMAIARAQGLDVARLEADMKAPQVNAVLDTNFALAQALHIDGTPAFVIAGQIVPGAVDRASLEKLIAEARKKTG